MKIRLYILSIISGFCFSLSGQNHTSREYEVLFRFDTTKAYPGVKRIIHKSYNAGKINKHLSHKFELNNYGQSINCTGIPNPNYPCFMLQGENFDLLKRKRINQLLDSLGREVLAVYCKSDLTEEYDTLTYSLRYNGSSKRPFAISEFQYVNFVDSTELIEEFELEYLSNEILFKNLKSKIDRRHYVYNRQGNLIKFYIEGIKPGDRLVFPPHSESITSFDHIPIEFDYMYDEKGRVTAMYETTGGKRDLLFTRKYILK